MIGPSFELPVTGARHIVTTDPFDGHATVKRQGQATITLAVTAGIVVSLP